MIPLGRRDGGILEQRIHQGAEPPQVHLLRRLQVEQGRGQRRVATDIQRVLRVHAVVPVAQRPVPVAAEVQIDVPGEHLPQSGVFGVAIHVIIFMATVHVADERHRGEEIERFGEVHVVIQIPHQVRARLLGAADQRRQIRFVFISARLLLCRAYVGHRVIHLVERSVGVPADPLQIIVIAVFHHVPIAVEVGVQLHADRDDPVIGRARAGVAVGFVPEHVPHVRLVGISGEQVDVIDPRFVRVVAEVVIPVEVHVVTLLGKARAGLAMDSGGQVVVKFALEIPRAARGAGVDDVVGVLREPMQDREPIGQRWIEHDGAKVLSGIQRVGIGRQAGQVGARVGGGDVITHHLPGLGGGAGDLRAENAVAGPPVPVQSVVQHEQVGFGRVHDPVVEPHHVDGIERGREPRGDHQILTGRRFMRRVRHVQNQRAELGIAEAVERAGCRGRKIILHGGIDHRTCGDQLWQQQKIRVPRACIQPVNRQDVRARLQQVPHSGQVKILKLDRVRVRMRRRGRRIPRRQDRRVARGHLDAVEIGDEAIVVLHAQSERVEARQIRHGERNAQIRGGVDVAHGAFQVRCDLIAEARLAVDDGVHENLIADGVRARLDGQVDEVARLHVRDHRGAAGAGEVSASEGEGVSLGAVLQNARRDAAAARLLFAHVPIDRDRPAHFADPAADDPMLVGFVAGLQGDAAGIAHRLVDARPRGITVKPIPRFTIPEIGRAVRAGAAGERDKVCRLVAGDRVGGDVVIAVKPILVALGPGLGPIRDRIGHHLGASHGANHGRERGQVALAVVGRAGIDHEINPRTDTRRDDDGKTDAGAEDRPLENLRAIDKDPSNRAVAAGRIRAITGQRSRDADGSVALANVAPDRPFDGPGRIGAIPGRVPGSAAHLGRRRIAPSRQVPLRSVPIIGVG